MCTYEIFCERESNMGLWYSKPMIESVFHRVSLHLSDESYSNASFHEQEWVRQKGVQSPSFYNVCVDLLLETYRALQLVCHIGSIYCKSPTAADDIDIAYFDSDELQLILDIQDQYACHEKYSINQTKLQVLRLNNVQSAADYYSNELRLRIPRGCIHPGILRGNHPEHGT